MILLSELIATGYANTLTPLQQKISAAYAAKGDNYRPRTRHFIHDKPEFINRLILEDSPYLLQHAHNPVNWYPWGEEAFQAAKDQNKLIFLSIGYSTCHWCHVMEEESFENRNIADYLNTHYISIKVDREQRPDLDAIYMVAVQLISGSGGWPMSSILTPTGQTIIGGTYYQPDKFLDMLQQIQNYWQEIPDQLWQQAQQVTDAVTESMQRKQTLATIDPDIMARAVQQLEKMHDDFQGGFGDAPKFPNEPRLALLLRDYWRNGSTNAAKILENDLIAMANGGIHDQIGGGFHRYSTDNEWLVPHFEKMLYNQSQLARIYTGYWQLTANPIYERIARRTLDYVLREMTAPDGGFYSATDADSEGEEGTYFVWTPQQLKQVLTDQQFQQVTEIYSITENGNFEGANIPYFYETPTIEQLRYIDRINERLYTARSQREPPLRDEKVITAWNGMMITAFAEAGTALQEDTYIQAAITAAELLWQKHRQTDGKLWRTRLNGHASVDAVDEDYAFYAEALLTLFDITQQKMWLERAEQIIAVLLDHFRDNDTGALYINLESASASAMIRPKIGSDNAIPSGNGVTARVMVQLYHRTGEQNYKEVAEQILAHFATEIARYPTAYSTLIVAHDELLHGDGENRLLGAHGNLRIVPRWQQSAVNDAIVVKLECTIASGWKLSAESLQISTTEKASTNWIINSIDTGQAKTQVTLFGEEPQRIFSANTTFSLQLNKKSQQIQPLQLIISYQMCNQQICLPPEKRFLTLQQRNH